MSNPLLSILMMYRTPPYFPGSPRRNIIKFLENFNEFFSDSDKEKIELLIRMDSDDKVAIDLISTIKKQPFEIKVFVWKRWEGRFTFNYNQTYLFSKINPKTRFVMTLNDDSYFKGEEIKNLITDLVQYKDEKYIILSPIGISLTKVIITPHPIISRKIIECMGSTGWLTFIDDTIGLITYFLYKDYKIKITKKLSSILIYRKDNIREKAHLGPLDSRKTFNIDTQLTDPSYNKDNYFYELTRQQAKNIYLNMKEDNELNKE